MLIENAAPQGQLPILLLYGRLTTHPETLPNNSTSLVMVAAPDVALKQIGDSYGFRTWIEYGFKQAKDALGWADFRGTRYE